MRALGFALASLAISWQIVDSSVGRRLCSRPSLSEIT
jgi:hypothetical protein